MNKNPSISLSFLLGAALLSWQSPASAGSESYTANFGSLSSPLPVDADNFPFYVLLPKFDTTLGVLSDVTVTLDTTGLLQASVANFGPSTDFQNAGASGTITISALGAQSQVPLTATSFSGSIAAGSLLLPTFAFGPVTSGSDTGTSDVAMSDYGAYEGSGGGIVDFWLDGSFNGGFSGDAPPGAAFGAEASVFGTISVQYTYLAAVPDGGGLLPAGLLCLAGLAAFHRFQRIRSGQVS